MIIRTLSASSATRIAAISSRFSRKSALLLALLAAITALGVSGCGVRLYKFPEYNFAGRPVPPSLLANRVMVSFTTGSSGSLQILDALRDIRMNIENTIHQFFITGYTGDKPTTIINFPDELRGYVYSNSTYAVSVINYGKENTTGTAASLGSPSSGLGTSSNFTRLVSAQESTGQLLVADSTNGATYPLNLPNVYQVAVNQGGTVILAMVRNSNSLYRVVKLSLGELNPPGSVDCEPTILPVYCVVPVPGTFDRPVSALFSLDGATAYVLSCGQECGGGTNGGAGVSFISQEVLQVNTIPTSVPYPAVVTNSVAIPGGVTAGLVNGGNMYLAGQQLQNDGLYTGFMTTLPLSTLVPTAPVSIADGYHSKLLYADDNTVWIAAQQCATGERQKLFAAGNTTQAANYNCLTRVALPTGTGAATATIVPAVSQAVGSAAPVTVPYPNQNQNLYYYGSLTGLCWVQGLHKVYTAYGGQVHAFSTATSTEINNQYITIQGTALDVAYIDATDDVAD